MDADSATSEHTRLLDTQQHNNVKKGNDSLRRSFSLQVLPISFIAAMALAATAATETFAYAAILCKNPRHCQDAERNRFAGTVSIAVSIANICSLFALGPLITISKRSHRAGLFVWTVCRFMSVVALMLGVHFKSIILLLSGRIFEGSASDNLLHFNLNAIYVQNIDHQTVARMIGSSLALYMIGICLAPLIAGALPNFQSSFYLASALFAVIGIYLFIIPVRPYNRARIRSSAPWLQAQYRDVAEDESCLTNLDNLSRASLRPLTVLKTNPVVLLPSLSLMLYNLVQSFAFAAMMTYTTLTFGFTGRENGFVLSIAHAVAATYLLTSSYILPKVQRAFRGSRFGGGNECDQEVTTSPRDGLAALAIASTFLEALSLTLIGFAKESWQIYVIVVLLATGLSTPSFIKSYVMTLVPHAKAGEAIAILAVAEVSGSLLAPFILGGLLASRPGPVVFFVASGTLYASSIVLAGSMLSNRYKRRQSRAHMASPEVDEEFI